MRVIPEPISFNTINHDIYDRSSCLKILHKIDDNLYFVEVLKSSMFIVGSKMDFHAMWFMKANCCPDYLR